MSNEKELQENVLAYRILENRLEGFLKQHELLTNKVAEIQTTLKTMDEIKKEKEVLFPLGGEAYAHGKISEARNMIVEIGAGFALEKTHEEGKIILNGRKGELEKALDNLQKEISDLSLTLQQLGMKIEKMQQ